MKVYSTQVGAIDTNCYLLQTGEKTCVFLDPGAEGNRLLEWAVKLDLEPIAILLTHGHFDHIGGVENIMEQHPSLPIYINHEEFPVVEWSREMMPTVEDSVEIILEQGRNVVDGQTIELDATTFTAMTTPGHTQGSVVYMAENRMFSGDTVFFEEIGRCDLFTGDYDIMLKSLEKLAALPINYRIYPGHDQSTTLEHEKKHNPYMKKVL